MAPRANEQARVQALLGKDTSIEYVTGMIHYLSDQLQTMPGFQDLSAQDQQRVLLIGYNEGWENLKYNIEALGFGPLIAREVYDNQTLDEYLRWRANQ